MLLLLLLCSLLKMIIATDTECPYITSSEDRRFNKSTIKINCSDSF